MKITLKLFASLGKHLPAGTQSNEVVLEVPARTTPHDLIDRYNVPREMAHLVLLNGVYVDAGDRDTVTLQSGDALAVWPPVAGG